MFATMAIPNAAMIVFLTTSPCTWRFDGCPEASLADVPQGVLLCLSQRHKVRALDVQPFTSFKSRAGDLASSVLAYAELPTRVFLQKFKRRLDFFAVLGF
jgi:hypothetical protein